MLTFPVITTFALVVIPFVMYFTSWYTAAFSSTTVRELTYLALMAPGFVFFWTLLRVDPVPKAYPYAVSLWITAAEVIGDAILGLALIADQNLVGGRTITLWPGPGDRPCRPIRFSAGGRCGCSATSSGSRSSPPR